jgi:Leucine-rich repeat (LRR) protein
MKHNTSVAADTTMGTASSTAGIEKVSSPSHTKGRRVQTAKLKAAASTGVLNLSDQDLKLGSLLWPKLLDPRLSLVLKGLDISGNEMKSLPNEVYGLQSLKKLSASRCSLQSTQSMAGLAFLQKLMLDHNDLEESSLGPLSPTLTHLYLSFNHLRRPPPSLRSLSLLVVLDLSGNRLAALDDDDDDNNNNNNNNSNNLFDSLTALVELNLDDNRLEEVPQSLSRVATLRRLSLNRNLLQRLSPTTRQQCIPRQVFEATQLEKLELAGNTLLTKEVLAFEGVDRLLQRRQHTKDKAVQGGALFDSTLFGLD